MTDRYETSIAGGPIHALLVVALSLTMIVPGEAEQLQPVTMESLRSLVVERGTSETTDCKLLASVGLSGPVPVKRVSALTDDGVKHVFNALDGAVGKERSILVRYCPHVTECFLVSGDGKLLTAVATKARGSKTIDKQEGMLKLSEESKFWQRQLERQ